MGWPGPMTHRQFMAYYAWDRMQMNTPGKIEYYLMLIAYYVAAGNSKNPKSLSLDKMKIRFGDTETGQEAPNPEKVRYQKAMALARLGSAPIRLPDGTIISKEEILGLPPSRKSNRSEAIDEMIEKHEASEVTNMHTKKQ